MGRVEAREIGREVAALEAGRDNADDGRLCSAAFLEGGRRADALSPYRPMFCAADVLGRML
jgi:hypothetical protein